MQGRLAMCKDLHFGPLYFFVMIHVSETQAVQLPILHEVNVHLLNNDCPRAYMFQHR